MWRGEHYIKVGLTPQRGRIPLKPQFWGGLKCPNSRSNRAILAVSSPADVEICVIRLDRGLIVVHKLKVYSQEAQHGQAEAAVEDEGHELGRGGLAARVEDQERNVKSLAANDGDDEVARCEHDIEEEEHEKLTVVEADAVAHPRAEVVHVQH